MFCNALYRTSFEISPLATLGRNDGKAMRRSGMTERDGVWQNCGNEGTGFEISPLATLGRNDRKEAWPE